LWLDIVADSAVVQRVAFQMQTQCGKVFKSAAYTLKANAPLILQMNGSKAETITVTITPWAP
jgi:hypothetical protein